MALAFDTRSPTMKKYLLSIMQPDGPAPEPKALSKIMQDLDALNREMREAGAFLFTDGLTPASSATVLRPKAGEVLVTDGPFVEGKEHVGGLWIIKAPDLDAALKWARRAALATTLPIEVRAFFTDAEG
jgi:hypothetical protein